MNKQFFLIILIIVFVFLTFYYTSGPSGITLPSQNAYTQVSQSDIVIYNRIPKTGSTTFTNAIGYDLCKTNHFNAIHINITKNLNYLNVADQASFVKNATEWKEKLPAFYHGHMAFLNFNKFGYKNPIYINLLRDPLERFVSYYYFLRYGDNFRIGLKRSRSGNNVTFDECIQKKGRDCDLEKMWVQIPYFCGHYSFCRKPGNKMALETAKYNLINYYLLVGYTDRIRDMIMLLERTVPRFFRGALKHFDGLDENRAHLRSTTKKILPKKETVDKISQNTIYAMEKEFYDFAVDEFDSAYEKVIDEENETKYHYEKIKP